MNLREALRTQGPSYGLQEAARDEIARLDARAGVLAQYVQKLEQSLLIIAAQTSGVPGSTAKADCMAAIAQAALR